MKLLIKKTKDNKTDEKEKMMKKFMSMTEQKQKWLAHYTRETAHTEAVCKNDNYYLESQEDEQCQNKFLCGLDCRQKYVCKAKPFQLFNFTAGIPLLEMGKELVYHYNSMFKTDFFWYSGIK